MLSILGLLLSFFSINPARADSPSKPLYLDELKTKARQLHLSTELQWLNLLHYKKGWGGTESQVTGPNFFLSDNGRSDPEEELQADLAGFFSTRAYDGVQEFHPRCQFPARYKWLKEKLAIDERLLPPADCTKMQKYFDLLAAESITVVFSSYYLNNPSSAFGHSFIRVNSRKSKGTRGEHHELLDHGINYAAEVGNTNPFSYAYLSLTGGFRGTFTSIPYYYKVREYNDFESRDLWGYDLNLTEKEVERFMDHTWELGGTYFDYTYFKQNCAYHVLTLLEAAAPRLELTKTLPFYVIPGDTIRLLNQTPGLVTHVSYRPSLRAQFKEKLRTLSPEEIRLATQISKTKNLSEIPEKLSMESKARVLDAVSDSVELANAEAVLKEDPAISQWRQKILIERAKTRVRREAVTVAPPDLEAPQTGHPSGRLSLEAGAGGKQGGFTTLGARLALHDLLDPEAGYPANSQIEFANVKVRQNADFSKTELNELTLVRITSLSPWTEFSRPFSFRAQLGAQRFLDQNCDRCLGGAFEGGPGITLQPFGGSVVNTYAIADFQVAYSPGFVGSNVRLGVGPSAGILLNLTPSFKTLLSTTYRYLAFSLENSTYQAGVETRFSIGPRVALNLRGAKWIGDWESAGGILWYF